MKKIKYLFIALVLGFSATFSSCVDMDLTPRGMLDQNVLFASEHGIKTYLAIIYNELPTEDFQFSLHPPSGGYIRRSTPSGVNNWETAKFHTAGFAEAVSRLDHGAHVGIGFAHWERPFEMIRRINAFLYAIPNFHEHHSEQRINELIGEARFLRAFYYFSMVRLYGGLPIVTEALNPALPIEELQLPRATEFETHMFIYEDLRFAMENMPATAVRGRATRYVAAALMTRAMLHAASIANFFDYVPLTGPAAQAGLQGMRRTQAADFYRKVIEAADFITNGNQHRLHDIPADRERAFVEVFTIPTAEEIFVRQGMPGGTGIPTSPSQLHNSWDTNVLPLGTNMATHVGAHLHPSWNLLRLFQMPAISEYNAQGELVPVRFACRNDLWDNDEMEPRARATIFFSGMTETYSRTVMDFQAGVFTSLGPGGNATVAQLLPPVPLHTNDLLDAYRFRHTGTGPFPAYENVPLFGRQRVAGAHGVRWSGDEGQTVTGVTIRKYVNPNPGPGERQVNRGSQAFKVFRYGEVVLNRAEARFELGLLTNNESMQQEAFVDINRIRERAGARPQAWIAGAQDVGYLINAVYEIDENRQFIRDERARELAFEHHTFFDLRRWRVAHTKIHNFVHRGLFPYYILDEGKWVFLNQIATFHRPRTLARSNYYIQIPGGVLGRNPNLLRNDDL